MNILFYVPTRAIKNYSNIGKYSKDETFDSILYTFLSYVPWQNYLLRKMI